MRQKIVVGMILVTGGFSLAGCSDSSSPSSPSSGGTTTPANVTVSIVGNTGAQAFNPNPVSVPVGQTLAFRNTTGETHRIVQDGGGFDSGNIAPGSTSSLFAATGPNATMNALVTVSSATAMSFHCTIHPSMVGTINGSGTSGGGSSGDETGSGGSGSGDGY